MWNEMGNWHWGWVGFGALHMLLFWVLIILAVFVLIRFLSNSSGGGDRSIDVTPLDLLKTRYARGEIDRDEFEEKKRGLQE